VYPAGGVLMAGAASSVPHDSQKLSVTSTGAPHDGQTLAGGNGPVVT